MVDNILKFNAPLLDGQRFTYRLIPYTDTEPTLYAVHGWQNGRFRGLVCIGGPPITSPSPALLIDWLRNMGWTEEPDDTAGEAMPM